MSAPAPTRENPRTNDRLSIVFFKNVYDVHLGRTQNIAWEELVQLLSVRDVREAKDGPLFSLTAVRPGATRGIASVTALSGGVLDLDDIKDVSAVRARMAAYEYVLYTTHSHGEKGNRYRIVLPFARSVPPAEWPAIWNGLNTVVGGVLDPAARDVARISYLPSCPKSREHLAEFVHNRGAWIDPGFLLQRQASVTSSERKVVSLHEWKCAGNAAAVGGIDIPPDPTAGVREGSRNDGLARLLGHWIGQGLTKEESLAEAHKWNTRNQPPLSDEEVGRTHASIWRKHEGSIASAADVELVAQAAPVSPVRTVSWGAADPVKPLFDVQDASVRGHLERVPLPRRYLLNDCLPAGKVGSIVAPGGTGKSQLVLQLAISVATGLPLAGGAWGIGESGGVLMLCAEDDVEEIHRRLYYTARATKDGAMPENLISLLDRRLFVRSMVAENNLMTVVEAVHGNIYRTEYTDRLIATARLIPDLKLIIIDPASRFRGGNENSSDDVTRFIETLEYVSKQTGASVLAVHHANKASMQGSEQTQAASRGSSAFSDGIRWQMNLAGMTEKEAKSYGIPDDQRHMYLSATVTKNNYAPPQTPVFLRRLAHGVLVKADLTDARKREDRNTVIEIVEKVASSKERYSARSFTEAYGGKTNVFRMGQNALGGYVNQAIEHGYLAKGGDRRGLLAVTELGRDVLRMCNQPDSAIAE